MRSALAGEILIAIAIRDRTVLEAHLTRWHDADDEVAKGLPIGYVLSLEGADSIVTLEYLQRSYGDGLRALGPAHYGPGAYAHGTDASGPLPPKGKDLLREMQRLGRLRQLLDAKRLSVN